jgi:30S ribosomal protein 3
MIGLRAPRARAAATAACPQARRLRRSVRTRAADVDADVAADDEFVMVDEGDGPAGAGEAYAEAEAPAPKREVPLPTYFINCLYLDKAVGLAVDQELASGERGPVTEYYWWPAKDAWEELSNQLNAMPWISQNEVITLLNTATAIINFWQNPEARPTLEEARAEFTDVTFYGA